MAGDLDLDLWSVQYWLELLATGDTGAQDLIFAPSYPEAVIHLDLRLKPFFEEPLRLLNTIEGRAYAEYSLNQAKKYGIKGSRLGAFRALQRHLLADGPLDPHVRLKDRLSTLVAAGGDENFCRLAEVQNRPGLYLGGKLFAGGLKLVDFARWLEAEMARYGHRAVEAEANRGLDFKALSHAVRALSQMREIFETGRLVFPLQNREELMAIKAGNFSWAELEPLILDRLAEVDRLKDTAPFEGRHEPDRARRLLLSCYGLAPLDKTESGPLFEAGFEPPPAAWEFIRDRLSGLEQEHGVKILYACESGSRGWGFASPDSDFDVRFIYVHPRDWYLSLKEKRDVLEPGLMETPEGIFDLSGWDLRKALRLFRTGNPVILEWLSSPAIYRRCNSFWAGLTSLVPAAWSPIKSWYHYSGMMQKQLKAIKDGERRLKNWLYLLRSLSALKWLRKGLGPVPMRFDRLLDGVVEDQELRRAINQMIEAKSRSGEKDDETPPDLVVSFVTVEETATVPPDFPQQTPLLLGSLDDFFLSLLPISFGK